MASFFCITNYSIFVVTLLGFMFLPGPGNLVLMSSSAKGGILGGYSAMLGVMLGDQVLLWLSLGGVAAVLAAYPAVFASVQALGAGYLVWLGGKMVFSSLKNHRAFYPPSERGGPGGICDLPKRPPTYMAANRSIANPPCPPF